jgi:hypothetical protein
MFLDTLVLKASCMKLVRFRVIGLIWKPHRPVKVSSLKLMSIATSIDLGIHVTYGGASGLAYLESAFASESRLFRTNGRPLVFFFSPSRDITITFGWSRRNSRAKDDVDNEYSATSKVEIQNANWGYKRDTQRSQKLLVSMNESFTTLYVLEAEKITKCQGQSHC